MNAVPLGGKKGGWQLQIHQQAQDELLALPHHLQVRLANAFTNLELDPRRPRPGADIKKLVAVRPGSLYRLRVGQARACYLLTTDAREVWVLVIEQRGVGYDRMISHAIARSALLFKPDR